MRPKIHTDTKINTLRPFGERQPCRDSSEVQEMLRAMTSWQRVEAVMDRIDFKRL